MNDSNCKFKPEPSGHEVVMQTHDYIGSKSQVVGTSTSASTTKRKRSTTQEEEEEELWK